MQYVNPHFVTSLHKTCYYLHTQHCSNTQLLDINNCDKWNKTLLVRAKHSYDLIIYGYALALNVQKKQSE